MIMIEQTENEIHPQFLLKGRKILMIYTNELNRKYPQYWSYQLSISGKLWHMSMFLKQ